MEFELKADAPTFIFNPDAPLFCPSNPAPQTNLNLAHLPNQIQKPKRKFEKTLSDYLNKPKTKLNKVKPQKAEKPDGNKMVKAHIIVDGEVVTAKIQKKNLYSGAYEVVQRKTTKLKKIIKEHRKEEGIPPSQRPLKSNLQYREYVDQMLTQDLDLAIQEFLEKLKFYYQRKKQEKVNKKVSKRYVKGFKECLKKANDGSLKMLIMAPDIEKIEGEGGLDSMINELIQSCESHNIPIVFGLSMRSLGQVIINNAALISVIGIIDYSSTEKIFEKILDLQKRNKSQYKDYCFDPSTYFNLGINN